MDIQASLSYSIRALGIVVVAIASSEPVLADAAILSFDPNDSALQYPERSDIDENLGEAEINSDHRQDQAFLSQIEDGDRSRNENQLNNQLNIRERSPGSERRNVQTSSIVPSSSLSAAATVTSAPQDHIGIIDLQVPPTDNLVSGNLASEITVPDSSDDVSLFDQRFSEQQTSEQINTLGFEGESESLVAVAIGHAEGTRTPAGDRTPAYYGHADPGNGRWNLGSFSYQHCPEHTPPCTTPAAADRHQIQRLRHQSFLIQQQAHTLGLDLSAEELLNGLDLANQAPAAALDRGYLHWLKEARQAGMTGQEAILWARVRSFLDPDTQRWNAPGLGNNIDHITADQSRRMEAIARVMETHGLSLAADASDEDLP